METGGIGRAAGIVSRRGNLREKKKYRRLLWGMLFLELLIRKIQEKESYDLGGGRGTKVPQTGHAVICPANYAGRDTLEVTLEGYMRIALSESYARLTGDIRRAKWCREDGLFKEACGLMADYYGGRLDLEMAVHMARAYFCYYMKEKALEDTGDGGTGLGTDAYMDSGTDTDANAEAKNANANVNANINVNTKAETNANAETYLNAKAKTNANAETYSKAKAETNANAETYSNAKTRINPNPNANPGTDAGTGGLAGALRGIYECFSRANARKAVSANNGEGRRLVEESGLSWAGTTYYNARYYHACRQMQGKLMEICMELSSDYGIAAPDFALAEEESKFAADGGLSFHGVFEWVQKQNNYPPDQYGMKQKNAEPPEYFVYLYRNCFCGQEGRRVGRLAEKVQAKAGELITNTGGKMRQGNTQPCTTRQSYVQQGTAQPFTTRQGFELQGNTEQGSAQQGSALQGNTEPCTTQPCSALQGNTQQPCSAWQGNTQPCCVQAGEPVRPFFKQLMVEGGREYHNGLSYLLEDPPKEGWDDAFAGVMDFLAAFRLFRVSGCVEILCAGQGAGKH